MSFSRRNDADCICSGSIALPLKIDLNQEKISYFVTQLLKFYLPPYFFRQKKRKSVQDWRDKAYEVARRFFLLFSISATADAVILYESNVASHWKSSSKT